MSADSCISEKYRLLKKNNRENLRGEKNQLLLSIELAKKTNVLTANNYLPFPNFIYQTGKKY
jgi:hypothetical protein